MIEGPEKRLITELRRRLQLPLPGHPSHDRMKPSHGEQTKRLNQNCREAAVLTLLVPSADGPSIVLTQRPEDIKDHAGQIAFPGGTREAGERFEETAVRECFEEIGVHSDQFDVLGELTPLYIPPSNFCVHPFVAVAGERLSYVLQLEEVASVFEIPVARLTDPALETSEHRLYRGRPISVPVYLVDGKRIWGATAMILAELLDLLAGIDDDF